MARRLLDVALASLALVAALPLLAVAAMGILVSDPGPVLYRTRRAGARGRSFLMYKLRTMRRAPAAGARITGPADPRVFAFGRVLRLTKIDELPQLVNVLRGDMSLVGPRPEDPAFVMRHYATLHRETLDVRPGLASPGSIYSTTHGDRILAGGDPERRYLELLLPIKLALDVVYVRRAGLRYDLRLMARTAGVIAFAALGRRRFAEPPEMIEARGLMVPARNIAAQAASAREAAV